MRSTVVTFEVVNESDKYDDEVYGHALTEIDGYQLYSVDDRGVDADEPDITYVLENTRCVVFAGETEIGEYEYSDGIEVASEVVEEAVDIVLDNREGVYDSDIYYFTYGDCVVRWIRDVESINKMDAAIEEFEEEYGYEIGDDMFMARGSDIAIYELIDEPSQEWIEKGEYIIVADGLIQPIMNAFESHHRFEEQKSDLFLR